MPLPSKPEWLTFSHEAMKWGKWLHVIQPIRSRVGPCGHSFSEHYDLTQGKVTSSYEVRMLTEGRETLCLMTGLLLSSKWILLRGNTNPITTDVPVSVLSWSQNLKAGNPNGTLHMWWSLNSKVGKKHGESQSLNNSQLPFWREGITFWVELPSTELINYIQK